MYSSKFKKLVVCFSLFAQAVAPIAASAAQYVQLMAVNELKVVHGGELPEVNVDPTNTTANTTAVGNTTLKVAPSSIDFGSVPAGTQSAPRTVTLTNIGSASVVLGTVTAGTPFSVTSNCNGVTLPVLATCQVNVTFSPQQVTFGPYSTAVTVPMTSGGMNSTAMVALLGTGGVPSQQTASASLEGFNGSDPQMTLSAQNQPRIQFGEFLQSDASITKTFTLSSTGSGPVMFYGVALSGTPAGVTTSSNCPQSVAAGSTCTISVTYNPATAAVGATSTQLSVNTSLAGNPLTVAISGTTTAVTQFELSAATTNLGAVDVGSTLERSIQITNTGTTALLNPQITYSGSYLSFSHNCPSTLNAGASCNVTMVFAPQSPSAVSGQVNVVFANAGLQVTAIQGQGMGPVLTADSFLKSFGTVAVGDAKSVTYYISNDGNATAPLSISATPASLTRSGDCGATLLAGSVCHLVYTFSPAATGTLSESVTVSSTNNTLTLQMSGQGVAPAAFGVSSATVEYSSTNTGADSTQTIQLMNNGGVPLTSPQISTAGSSFSATHNCPASLSPGGTCEVSVKFTPQAPGALTGTLTVAWAETTGQTINLSGTGVGPSIELNVSSVAYTNVLYGSATIKPIIVKNVGTAPGALVVGALPSNMSYFGCSSPSIAVGSSCYLFLRYSPTQVETMSGTLNLSMGTTTASVAYAGNAIEKTEFTTYNTSIPFWTTNVGSTSNSVDVYLNNSGNTTLTGFSTAYVGTGQVNIINNTCPAQLAGGAGCVVTLQYAPTNNIPADGFFTAGYSQVPTISIPVSGQVQVDQVSIESGSPLNFGAVAIGGAAETRVVTVTTSYVGTGISVSSLPAGMSVTNPCSANLTPGSLCSLVFSYQPTAGALLSGSIRISGNFSYVDVPLSGSAHDTTSFYLSTSAVNFGNVNKDATATQTVTVTNNGSTVLPTPVPVIRDAQNVPYFAQTNNCSSTLAPGQSCTVTVSLTPSSIGTTLAAYLDVQVTGLSTQSTYLSGVGYGVAPYYTAFEGYNITSTAFGATSVGTNAPTRTIYLANGGNAPLVVTGAATISAPFYIASDACQGATLSGANYRCAITLGYHPSATGPVSANLSIPTSPALASSLLVQGSGI